MKELEKKALDCIKNHSHTLVQNATESDIEKREMELYIEGYKQCKREMQEENEQLKQGLKLYKKALELFVNWADECDFGYDNLGDLYSEYKDEVESLKYQEGLIHIAVSEAKKELTK